MWLKDTEEVTSSNQIHSISKRYISNENVIKLLDIIEAKYHDIIYTKEVPHEYL